MENTVIDQQVNYSMVEVKEILLSSMENILNNQDEDKSVAIFGFLTSLVGTYTPYVMLTPESMATVSGLVFENEVIRNFVLSLKFHFFGNLLRGRGRNIIDLIVKDLAISVSSDMGYAENAKGDLNTMPEHLTETYSDMAEAERVLFANTWVVCLLLIQLNINLDDFIQKETKKQTKKT
jgi:hypothetical protein